ncbi:MAG: hypothetical protein JNL87_17395 [Burkholderiaceae bacterium]|nr:hypothetical protein [Burkholderiaceae bacterium]
MHGHRRCVIDIEASGFGRHSYPIEVGFVREDDRAWCTLIQPSAGWVHWDPAAQRVHGIPRDALRQHGRRPQEVAQRLNDELAGRTVYCDGWAHDYPWLGRLFDEADLAPSFRLESVNRLLDEAQLAQLDRLRQDAFAVLGIERHRASSDARALQWALDRLAT